MDTDYMLITKVSNYEESIFPKMTRLSNQYSAINLAQGFPDFDCPKELLELASKYIIEGNNQYSAMEGFFPLRETISEKLFNTYKAVISATEEITVTTGATEAIFDAVSVLINPGDEAIIFEPAYDCYKPAIEISGGIAVPVNLTFPDYSIDWERVKGLITQKTKLIILNTPHNPTGTVLTNNDFKMLAEIVKDKNTYIISDEAYEHITYNDTKFNSILSYPELKSQSIAIYSLGKTLHTTGWRLGYAVAPKEITENIRKFHQFNTYTSITPIQYAAAEFLKDERNYNYLPDFFQKKRDYFRKLLGQTKFNLLPCEGSYFQLASFAGISDENDFNFAVRLIKEFGVGTIPVSAFYSDKTDNKVLRFCFAKREKVLENAVEKLIKL